MSDSNSNSLLRDAWNSSTGDAFVDSLLRQSLSAQASTAPEQLSTLRALQLAGRSQLDLHLEGRSESNHEAKASALGEFLTRAAAALRAVSKSVAGIDRIWGDVNVLAPAPGSVRIVLVEQGDLHLPEGARQSQDAWAEGMERVASTFELADEGRDELDASLLDLDLKSRNALRLLGQTVSESAWGIAGSLVSRDGAQRSIKLSSSGARRLVEAASAVPTRTASLETPGVVDGWRWSNSTVRLVPDRGAAIDAFVPKRLQHVVADANAHRGLRVDALFSVIESVSKSRSAETKTSYTLEDLKVHLSLEDAWAEPETQ
ncbi:hypothetical protein [Oerskovia jenensis]|uniref:hypothetical protein n=1 Tax=Oerskovia jenensis TaxID=162169 RepID=UPI0036DCCADE